MSVKKYIVPILMGEPSSDLFLMRGALEPGQKSALVRLVSERAVTEKDERSIQSLINAGKLLSRPHRIREVEVITHKQSNAVTRKEASLIYGYIHNTLPGAFKAPELSKWYLFERPSDVTPLKMARFSINLLSHEERKAMVGWMSELKLDNNSSQLSQYR